MNTSPTTTDAPVNRRVVLLRGINVGKTSRIAMADLRLCTAEAGCTEVATVLATGNVVVTDPREPEELRTVLEAAYAERFDYGAIVQVINRDRVLQATEGYPFDSLDEHHDYVVFSDDPGVADRVVAEMSEALGPGGTEAVARGPGCIYWRVPRGSTLASAAGQVLDHRGNRQHMTTRNLKTLRKVLALG